MSIYQSPETDLAALLSTAIGVAVATTHFSVLGVVATPNGESAYNTKIRIKFNSQAAVSGEKTFYYDRLNLTDLQHLHPFTDGRLKSVAANGNSVYILIPALRDGLGITFTSSDLVETFAAGSDDGATILLKAKPTSLGWIGEYNVSLSPPPNFSVLFFSRDLTGY